jgi:hypothetical protein
MQRITVALVLFASVLSTTAAAQTVERFRLEDVDRPVQGAGLAIAPNARLELLVEESLTDPLRQRLDPTSRQTFVGPDICQSEYQWRLVTPISECRGRSQKARLSLKVTYKF